MVWCAESLKKRLMCYFLEHYAGWFLQDKLTLEQLSIDLYNGKGSVSDVNLNVDALNDVGEIHNLPIEFVEGYVGSISVRIPWASISSDSCAVEVKGLMVTIRPKQRTQNASSFDSMFESMSNSLHLTEEILKQDLKNEDAQQLEGYVSAAKRIETELKRMKIKFIDTTVRFEHYPTNSKVGVALELRIKCMDCFDEDAIAGHISPNSASHIEMSSISTKVIWLDGTTLYLDEFLSNNSPEAQSPGNHSSSSSPEYKSADVFKSSPVSPSVTGTAFAFSDASNSEVPGSNPIKVAQLVGKQEIKLKFVETNSVNDAKLTIEANIPYLISLLSPRQFHMLVNLIDDFITPDVITDEAKMGVNRPQQKQMESADFQRVQMELQNQLNRVDISNEITRPHHGWSSHPLDNSDEEFLPMAPEANGKMNRSQTSNMESSMCSSASNTTTASSFQHSKTNEKGSFSRRQSAKEANWQNLIDNNVDTSRFKLECNNLCIIVLHEDVLSTMSESPNGLSQSSIKQMRSIASDFFQKASILNLLSDDYDGANAKLSNICQTNHLRLLASSICLNGKDASNASISHFNFSLEATNLNFMECLFDKPQSTSGKPVIPEYTELLVLNKQKSNRSKRFSAPSNKAIKIDFDQITRLGARTKRIKSPVYTEPGTRIKISIDECKVEFDITMMDRIHALIQPQNYAPRNDKNAFNNFEEPEELYSLTIGAKTSVEISSPAVELCVRFPIPDLRPVHDMNRLPWWKRSIRTDVMTLELKNVLFTTSFSSSDIVSKFELQCEQVNGFFQESANDPRIAFLRACSDNVGCGSYGKSFDLPRLVFKTKPATPTSVLEDIAETECLPPMDSLDDFVDSFKSEQLSPFASKKVLFHNKRKVDGGVTKDYSSDEEEMVMPASKSKMSDFIEAALANSQMTLEIHLPNLDVQFNNKHTYEVIYNRISNDLLLWEPAAPQVHNNINNAKMSTGNHHPIGLDLASQFLRHDLDQKFSICESVRYESSSDSDDTNSMYFSSIEIGKRKKKRHKVLETPKRLPQHNLSISMTTNIGKLKACCPLRSSSGNVVPGHHGKMALGVQDASVFIVSGYGGEKQHGYITVQANRASFDHKGMLKSVSFEDTIAQTTDEQDLEHVVYKMTNGANFNGFRDRTDDMLSVAVKFRRQKNDISDEKAFKVAFKLHGSTVRYRVVNSAQSWLTQVMDFFDVVDYPVAGYTCPPIITELHLFVSNSSIDYRPLNLPLRCFVTMDTFSISSNITPQTSTSILRFIAEDACLFLSNKCLDVDVDIRKDYVCVVDLGFFELSLKMSNSDDSNIPRIDLQASNNILNIRTCSDSFRALCDLITYFADDGDLGGDNATNDQTINIQYEAPVVNTSVESDKNLSKFQEDQFKDMMADAMTDISSDSNSFHSDFGSPFAEPKFDDVGLTPLMKDYDEADCPRMVRSNHMTDIYCSSGEESDDEEFCILENDPGVGIKPKSGEPEFKILSSDPLKVVSNYFAVPVGKADVLRAPKHFPVPTYRYCLREMSIVWHMYGGHDLEDESLQTESDTQNPKTSPPTTPLSSPSKSCSVSETIIGYSKNQPEEISYTFADLDTAKTDDNITTLGGPKRDVNVLMELQMSKVRFQHEIYPEDTEQASRQVLMIHYFEIRDRLSSSQINKFLYQYTSESMPRQHLAQMITIKAVHLRPDLKHSAQECRLKVSILPLRLNIDQDALFFLHKFFTEIADDKSTTSNNINSASSPAKRSSCQTPPVMNIATPNSSRPSSNTCSFTEPSQRVFLQEEVDIQNLVSPIQESKAPPKPPIFFRSFTFSPAVPIRLDYHGKRVDMEQGALAGLLIGLAELNSSEFVLKALNHRHGLLGIERLLQYSVTEWINDIKKSQIPSLLAGVGPMNAIVQLVQGMKDLVWMPIEQYNKDGRIVRGLQRGASSFSTSTAMATLELTNRLVDTIQGAAQIAYIMLSPSSNTADKVSYSNRCYPADIRAGMTCAYYVVREGIDDTARTIYKVAATEHEKKGVTGAVGGVIRQFPPTLVKPIIIATKATSNVLGGMKNQLVPDARREAAEKWRNQE